LGGVVFVHGKSGPLREALRCVGALRRGGMQALVPAMSLSFGVVIERVFE